MSVRGSMALTIGSINPFRYRGYYYDEEIHMYYLMSRYYDPKIGRFINPDSVDYLGLESINGLNLYAYCNNDPVNKCDPTGHFAILALIGGILISTIIGGAISGGINAGIAAATGENVSAAFWGGFLTGAASTFGVAVGMAAGGLPGIVLCGLIGFVGGSGGNFLTQSLNGVDFKNIDWASVAFSGGVNALASIITMGSMNLWMSDSFNTALAGKTFGARFIEFMSYDFGATIASTYFGLLYGIGAGVLSLGELAVKKYLTTQKQLVLYV